MKTRTINARGQMTLGKEFLQHLGIQPLGKLEPEKLPGGRVTRQSAQPAQSVRGTGTIDSFIGCLSGYTTKIATPEEIDEAIKAGWAGKIKF